jgi:hypothetical protein
MNKHENRKMPESKSQANRKQAANDEMLGNALRNAIATQVDATLDQPLLTAAALTAQSTTQTTTVSALSRGQSTRAASDHASGRALTEVLHSPTPSAQPITLPGEQTPRWDSDQVGSASSPSGKLNTGRRKKIGLSLAAVAGLTAPLFALTRPTLFASKRADTQIVQVASAEDDEQFPVKLTAHDPGYVVSTFRPPTPTDGITLQSGLHLSNGSQWIDVTLQPASVETPQLTGGVSVMVGTETGYLVENTTEKFTNVFWKLGDRTVIAWGKAFGSARTELLAVLGQVRLTGDKLAFTSSAHKFTAVPLELARNNYYQIGFSPIKLRSNLDLISVTVSPSPSYLDDYLGQQTTVLRNGRKYSTFEAPSGPPSSQVSFRIGTTIVDLYSQVPLDQLLQFADTVREATPAEWEVVLEREIPDGSIPTTHVLVDGQLDEDDPSSAKFEFIAPVVKDAEKADCVKVVFNVLDKKKTSCIAKNSTEQFRLLETVTANGVTVVYGVDAPDERDNHVVRVTDAAGDVVAEDVTLDQRNFTGRAFGLALPNDSVAPFTVELFDYDREWYQSGDQLPETYVRPGSKPLATAIVKP